MDVEKIVEAAKALPIADRETIIMALGSSVLEELGDSSRSYGFSRSVSDDGGMSNASASISSPDDGGPREGMTRTVGSNVSHSHGVQLDRTQDKPK